MAGDATNFAREDIEAALAHRLKDKAEAAYRRGDALEKRRALMEAWAGFLESQQRSARQGADTEHTLYQRFACPRLAPERRSSVMPELMNRGAGEWWLPARRKAGTRRIRDPPEAEI